MLKSKWYTPAVQHATSLRASGDDAENKKIGVVPGIYQKGKKVTVIYLKENPSKFIIDDSINTTTPYIIIAIAAGITVIGIYRLIYI